MTEYAPTGRGKASCTPFKTPKTNRLKHQKPIDHKQGPFSGPTFACPFYLIGKVLHAFFKKYEKPSKSLSTNLIPDLGNNQDGGNLRLIRKQKFAGRFT